jgi:hypothetical protein
MIFTTNSERQQLEEIRAADEARAHTYRRAWEARNREAPQPAAFEIAREGRPLLRLHDHPPPEGVFHDSRRVFVERGEGDGLWVRGEIHKFPGYTFDAKLHDRPSRFGIEKGRILKLHVQDPRGRTVIEYERGWGVHRLPKQLAGVEIAAEPRFGKTRAVLKEILAGFPDRRQAERRTNRLDARLMDRGSGCNRVADRRASARPKERGREI